MPIYRHLAFQLLQPLGEDGRESVVKFNWHRINKKENLSQHVQNEQSLTDFNMQHLTSPEVEKQSHKITLKRKQIQKTIQENI